MASDRGFTLGTGGGGIDVSDAGTTLTLSGTAAGAGALTKNGAGTLVLSGTNTYTGGDTVNRGTLRAGSTKAFGSRRHDPGRRGRCDAGSRRVQQHDRRRSPAAARTAAT